jgi:hypothetical protein
MVKETAAEILGSFNPDLRREFLEQHPELMKSKRLLVPLSEVQPGKIKWLWYPYIQGNNLAIIRGDGGMGKSFLVCALMAAISRGQKDPMMPGILTGGGSRVIYFGQEDDDFVVLDRVKSAGGNTANVLYCQEQITLSDIDELRNIITEEKAKLVVFDPTQSYLGAKVNPNYANEVRPVMDGLRSLARETDCAIVLIEHLNKATTQSVIHRGSGSMDFVNAARSVLMVAPYPDPARPDVRVCLQIKTNSIPGVPMAFTIDHDGKFAWLGECDVTIDQVNSASMTFSKAKHDPLYEGIMALMKKHPDGWYGMAADLFVEISNLTGQTNMSPDAIGKRLPSITPLLDMSRIAWTKSRVSRGIAYSIFRKPM